MGLRACRGCGTRVSTAERVCPNCGVDDPTNRRRIGCGAFLLAGLLILGYSYLAAPWRWTGPSPPPPSPGPTQAATIPAAVPAVGPSDPNQEQARVAFRVVLAHQVPHAFTLADLQQAAGAQGRIVYRQNDPKDPQWVYRWSGTDASYMLATVRPSGFIEVQLRTAGDVVVTFNNTGEFYCDPLDCRARR
ncbi:MAG: hypothetical protein JO209_00565 [Acidisphaera sp.]|nr:hypothetical protein [Acidisphaera sp.]